MKQLKKITYYLFCSVIISGMVFCKSAGEKKEAEYRDSQFNQYVYEKTCVKIWPEVKTYMNREKFFLPDSPNGQTSFTVNSEWRDDSFGSSRVKKSLTIVAQEVEKKGCTLNITLNEEDTSGGQMTQRFKNRNTYYERELIAKIEPKRYEKIIKEGERIKGELDHQKK